LLIPSRFAWKPVKSPGEICPNKLIENSEMNIEMYVRSLEISSPNI